MPANNIIFDRDTRGPTPQSELIRERQIGILWLGWQASDQERKHAALSQLLAAVAIECIHTFEEKRVFTKCLIRTVVRLFFGRFRVSSTHVFVGT